MEIKLFLKGLPSQILSSLAVAVCLQVDIILLGILLGSEAMGAYGFASPILLICSAISGVLVTGVTSVCSRFVGSGDKNSITNVFTKSVIVSIVVSFLILVIMFFGASIIARTTGAEAGTEVYNQTIGYLKSYALGLPGIFLYSALCPYIQMVGKRKRIVVSILVMTVLDIILDLFFVEIINLGMFGIGLASSISEFVACIILLIYFLKKESLFKLSFTDWSKPIMGKVIICGLPLVINQFCRTIFRLVMNLFLVKYAGSSAVAAYAVFGSVSDICFAACNGIGINTQLLVGIYYGEEDAENLVKSLKQGIKWVFGFTFVIAALLFIFADYVPYVFVRDNAEVVKLTAHVIRLSIFTIVPLGMIGLFRNYYPVINKTINAVIISATANLIFSIPCIYILSAIMGADGLYISDFVAKVLTVGLIFAFGCVKSRKIDLTAKAVSLIDSTEIADVISSESFHVSSSKDLPVAVESSRSFCDRSGYSKIDAYMISLCIEEVANIIMENDFKADNMIEIRVIDKNEAFYVRLRDNCSCFNFVSYMNLYEFDDDVSHLGIRMVSNMISDAGYVDSLGFNCLTLKLNKHGSLANDVI